MGHGPPEVGAVMSISSWQRRLFAAAARDRGRERDVGPLGDGDLAAQALHLRQARPRIDEPGRRRERPTRGRCGALGHRHRARHHRGRPSRAVTRRPACAGRGRRDDAWSVPSLSQGQRVGPTNRRGGGLGAGHARAVAHDGRRVSGCQGAAPPSEHPGAARLAPPRRPGPMPGPRDMTRPRHPPRVTGAGS